MRLPAHIAALAAAPVLLSCGVDYSVLGGKACDPTGACTEGYVCDPGSRRCVPLEEFHPDAAGRVSDGGRAADAGRGHDAGGARDGGPHDTGHPDAAVQDAGAEDAGAVDSGGVDAGPRDAGGRDAAALDAAHDGGWTPDEGPVDGGVDDAGAPDTGPDDSGPPDAGVTDTGFIDAGLVVCTSGVLRCTGTTRLEKCRTDGSGWDLVSDCAVFCLTDHCVDCQPGTTICVGATNDVDECSADGMSWNWKEFCADYCMNGRCVDCKPGDKWCNAGGDLEECLSDGMTTSVTSCPSGCSDTALACYLCDPGGTVCDANFVDTCSGDGMSVVSHVDCCVPNSCSNGQCTDGSPHVTGASPSSVNVGSDVTITISGCQFHGDAQVWWCSGGCDHGYNWFQASNGSYVSRSATQIVYKVTNWGGSHNVDWQYRVHNPGDGDSNVTVMHAN